MICFSQLSPVLLEMPFKITSPLEVLSLDKLPAEIETKKLSIWGNGLSSLTPLTLWPVLWGGNLVVRAHNIPTGFASIP